MTREHPSPEAEAVMSETSVKDMCAREASGDKERCTFRERVMSGLLTARRCVSATCCFQTRVAVA